MRLKSLKLAGFKSFANPTTFGFSKDITAIVGPNGCGKSNVIDAIRWVLGESSAKQLRGGAMSDVIFAGVEGRAARSQASVELVFEHTQDEKFGIRHALNLYQELSLRRQITTDGKSDYFINGQKVRRRDVVDVFLGTGLSSRSYAVIEQGMIGKIIDADGLKLREFIEEGAGVSRYQARKDETQRQLSVACENLARLNDLQSELSRQKHSLEKQAQSAAIFEQIKAKLDNTDILLLNLRLYRAMIEHDQKKQAQQITEQDWQTLKNTAQNAQNAYNAITNKLSDVAFLKDSATTNYHQSSLAVQSASHLLETAQSEIQAVKVAIDELTQEEHKQQEAQDITVDEHAHNQTIQALNEQLQAMNETIFVQKNHSQNAAQQLHEDKQDLQNLKNKAQMINNQLSLNKSQLDRLDNALQKWHQKNEQLSSKQRNNSDDVQDQALQQEANALKNTQEVLSNQIDELNATIAHSLPALETLQHTLEQDKIALNKLNTAHAKTSGEYDTLHALTKSTAYKKINANSANSTSYPKIADNISLTPLGRQYSETLDKALEGLLGDAYVQLTSDGDAAALHHNQISHWLVSLSHQVDHQSTDSQDDNSQGIIALSKLIDSPKLTIWHKVHLLTEAPLLDGGDIFGQLCQRFGISPMAFIAPNGGIIHPYGVKFIGADGYFLTQKNKQLARLQLLDEQLSELESQIDQQKKTIAAKDKEYHHNKIAVQEYQAQLAQKQNDHHHNKQRHSELLAKIAAIDYQRRYLAEQSADLAQTKAELDKEISEQQALNQSLDHQKTTIDDQLQVLQQRVEVSDKMAFFAKKTLQEQQARQHDIQIALSDAKHSLALAKQAQIARQKASTMRQGILKNKRQLLADLTQKLPNLQHNFEDLTQKNIHNQQQLQAYNEQLAQLQNEQLAAQKKNADTDKAVEALQLQLSQMTANLAVATARLSDLGDKIKEREEGFNLAYRLSQFRQNPPTGDIKQLESTQKSLHKQLGEIGAVNLAAKDKLDELNLRLDPLCQDVADVSASISKLQDAIAEINQKTKKLFLQSLKVVNDELNALFAKVFGGGQASLSLIDDDNLAKADKWQAGLVLMAQPKGKKNSRLALLSGGEKTLTALCLIFAIFKQHPAPFCVLDEVDAPLDDANVARFVGLINELSRDVQFIFISHNKLAMQSAHELKGVTMPTAGISSLVSVNLDDAIGMINA